MRASVVCLEAYREQRREAGFRAWAHEALDRMLDGLEVAMDPAEPCPPTLYALTQAVRQERAAFTGAVVEGYVQRHYAAYLEQGEAACPQCGGIVRARPARRRTVPTLVGPVSLARPYFYCTACHHGFFPLDEALHLSPHAKQIDLQEAACELALDMPFERAAAWLSRYTEARLSDCTVQEVVQEVGQGLGVLQVCPTAEEIGRRIADAAQGRTWRPIVVLALDGAHLPTRPATAKGTRPGRKKVRARRRRWKGEYREAKGFRFFLLDGERIVQLISWHQVGDEQALGEALRQVKAAGLIPEDQVRLCAVADGAPWIWKWVSELFPSARQILDYYHCTGYLQAIAQTQFAADPVAGVQWVEGALARLFCGEGAGLLEAVQQMQPTSPEAAEALTAAHTYLGSRLQQIDYGSHRKGGYPLGSGGIESAHRFIAQVRLKRSGTWWYEENSNAMPALRCALYNGTLQRVFEQQLGQARPPTSPNTPTHEL
ncbi:MAG: ISKra4 family transposase [Candidatus Latescibacterota bacterium]